MGHTRPVTTGPTAEHVEHPWRALIALCLGFFMILVDTTIVSIATPALMADLDANVTQALWITSGYLLAYAVPLLVTGRLGDRFGPRRLYLTGLAVFTAASLACGLSSTLAGLVAARVVQGLGAACMTPQTMAIITRTFPAANRGRAMSLWGATAGVASLVGPALGGVLLVSAGWPWIFFVNIPVGIVAFALAWRFVPVLERHPHRFDWLGVALSAAGTFLVVFGIQEGETFSWGAIAGPVQIWHLIAAGVLLLLAFVATQSRRREPLLPLALFRDRNFSLASLGITAVGATVAAHALPFILYGQNARGWSALEVALIMAPSAVLGGVLAPVAGRLVDRVHPRYVGGVGLALFSLSLVWLALLMRADAPPVWVFLFPFALLGVANAGTWSPLSTTATRNLPGAWAGAGSGFYNTSRQMGSVLGSAAIAALLTARLAAHLPGTTTGATPPTTADAAAHTSAAVDAAGTAVDAAGGLPPGLIDSYGAAMAEAMILPAAVVLVAWVCALCFERPGHLGPRRPRA